MRSRLNRFAPARMAWGLALALLLLASRATPQAAGPARAGEESFKRVTAKFVCQCGCNYPLGACPHQDCGFSIPMQQNIRAALASGLSEQQVIDQMVSQYGLAVLAAPPARGFNLMAWIMPWVGLLAGLVIVRSVMVAWRRRGRLAPSPSGPLAEKYQRTIDEEFRQLGE